MSYRLLFVTDLHKRWSDISTIKGLLPVQHKIQHDIINFCTDNNVTHVFIAGDWYDRGYHGIGQAYSAMEEDRLLSECVNGNVYLCLGNHFYLERDENPEMYIIQPCAYVKPKDILQTARKPLFNVVPYVILGNVQVSLFHYNKLNKAYRNPIQEGVTYHIGVYHDEVCVPAWVREREGFTGITSVYGLNQLYKNVDLAIHGHIHSDIGYVGLELEDGRTVPMYIPGSLGISQNKEAIKHKEVNLPIVDIDDEGHVSVSTACFSTHIDELTFHAGKSMKKKMPVTNNKAVTYTRDTRTYSNLIAYVRENGLDDKQVKLITEAMHERLDISSAIGIVTEVI